MSKPNPTPDDFAFVAEQTGRGLNAVKIKYNRTQAKLNGPKAPVERWSKKDAQFMYDTVKMMEAALERKLKGQEWLETRVVRKTSRRA